MVLDMILSQHKSQCTQLANSCPCQAIREPDPTLGESSSQQVTEWYELLRKFCQLGITKFRRSGKLRLLCAFIYNSKLNKRYQAIKYLYEAQNNKCSLLEKYAIYHLKLGIQKQMVGDEMRSSDQDGIDIVKLTKFQENFSRFTQEMAKVVDFSAEFWDKMTDQTDPNYQELSMLSGQITTRMDAIDIQFEEIREMFPSHSRNLRLYGQFLKKVKFDRLAASQYIQQAVYYEKIVIAAKNVSSNFAT